MALTVACGGACDSGSGHGGLVMAFMSTMVLGLKRREQTKENKTREGNEIIRRKREKNQSNNKIIIFNYTIGTIWQSDWSITLRV